MSLKSTLAFGGMDEKIQGKAYNPSYKGRARMTEMQAVSMASRFVGKDGAPTKISEGAMPAPIVIEDTRPPQPARPNPSLDSQLAVIFKPSKDYSDVALQQQKKNSSLASATYSPEDLIGGQEPENDRFQTVTKASMNGENVADKKRPQGLKKVEGKAQSPEVISPITNLKLADYGTWEVDAKIAEIHKKRDVELENAIKEEEERALGSDPIMRKLKKTLAKRGAKGLAGLARRFKFMDADHSGVLDVVEFKNALRETKVGLTDDEAATLFGSFDKDKSGSITYNEFLQAVSGELSIRRKRMVSLAFDVLDKDGNGVVEISDIAAAYDVSRHPEFISGSRTKEDILLEFLSGFEVGGQKDNKVTREEFENYYAALSASIDSDNYFELMIRNAWHITGGEGEAANSSNLRVLVTHSDGTQEVVTLLNDLGVQAGNKREIVNRLREQGVDVMAIPGFTDKKGSAAALKAAAETSAISAELGGLGQPESGSKKTPPHFRSDVPTNSRQGIADQLRKAVRKERGGTLNSEGAVLLDKLRDALKKRGARGFCGLQRSFRLMDVDGSRSLDRDEFKNAMKSINILLSERQFEELFQYFDTDQSGTIEYDEFLRGLRGAIPERRKRLVLQAFNVLDRDGSGVVDATDVAMIYDASEHPMVMSGAKSTDEVLREFLDTFDVGGEVDGKVTRDEFVNYYTNISANIDDDNYFELMIRNAWHIAGGEGAAANSANRRVLVTGADGSQKVEAITNDLGLKADDKEGMVARLRAQGVNAANIELYGGMDDTKGAKKPQPPSISPIAAQQAPGRLTKLPGGGTRYRVPPTATGDAGMQLSMGSSGPPAAPSSASAPRARAPPPKVDPWSKLITQIKDAMKKRGSSGLIGLQRKFRAMDKDGSKTLSKQEFKLALQDMGFRLEDGEVYGLFEYFDLDKSGTIDFEEVLHALRDPLSNKRMQLINMAFAVIDKDGNGVVDAAEVASSYDASMHPAVITGAKTKDAVLREFLDTFDVGGEVDGKVTCDEFVNYYTNISSSIESDDYFELMIRNAWHIAGGEGAAANSANRRVLVTGADGSQKVEAITNDLGLKADDKEGMVARLRAQGVNAANIELYGGMEMEESREDGEKSIPPEAQGHVDQLRQTALQNFNKQDYSGAMQAFEELLAILQSYLAQPEGLAPHPDVSKAMKSMRLCEKKLAAQNRQKAKSKLP